MKKIWTATLVLLIASGLWAKPISAIVVSLKVRPAADPVKFIKCSADKITVCKSPGSVSTQLDSIKKLPPHTYILVHRSDSSGWQVEDTAKGKKDCLANTNIKKISVLEGDIMVLDVHYPALKYAFILE